MRQREWVRCKDVKRMLDEVAWIPGQGNHRRVRLFVLAACRRLLEQSEDESICRGVEVAWRQAEGVATSEEINQAIDSLAQAYHSPTDDPNSEVQRLVHALGILYREPGSAAFELITPFSLVGGGRRVPLLTSNELNACCGLLRDIFADRGYQEGIEPSILCWQSGLIPKLAQAAYDEWQLPAGTLDNTRLAILADALEEAGCTDAEILGHLRGPGPHVRGCWPVDLCLGKS